MVELVNALGARVQSGALFCFWIKYEAETADSGSSGASVALPAGARVYCAEDRDALPGQLALRGNKIPSVSAQRGGRLHRCRLSLCRNDVGGPYIDRV